MGVEARRGVGYGSVGVHVKGVLAGESYRISRNQLTLRGPGVKASE